jgi:nuclear transcription factor Y alpha
MMPAKPGNEVERLEHGGQTVLQSTAYSQPWWRGMGNNGSFGENASKSSSIEHLNGSVRNGAIKSKANGLPDDGAKFNKETRGTVASQSGSYHLSCPLLIELSCEDILIIFCVCVCTLAFTSYRM